MKLNSIGELMAERKFELLDEAGGTRQIVVSIGRPCEFPNKQDFYCPYQIRGIGLEKVRYAAGVDSMQALLLALRGIVFHLTSAQEVKENKVRWNDDINLGFNSVLSDSGTG